MASDAAQRLIDSFSEYGDDFTPDLVVETLRERARLNDDEFLEILCDLIEGLWDEVKRQRHIVNVLMDRKRKPKR